ncbi:MAG: domain S-box protein [Chitinophagaceae bacterium]|nr:domain S-box protein [Chitinophagaceae bacterium]
MAFLNTIWYKMIRIGYRSGMDYAERMRLFTINAFLTIVLLLTLLLTVICYFIGTKGALEGLWLFPFGGLIFYLNHLGKIKPARNFLMIGLLPLLTALAISDRRTGTEFTIIAVGCCSILMFNRLLNVFIYFLYSFACYLLYFLYDSSHPFYPDPNTPYAFLQNILMFLSGFTVVAQSMVFRGIINTYSNDLKKVSDEVHAKNKELESFNQLLVEFSTNLDHLVQEKSAQLKAYSDAIDLYTCSAVISFDGIFLKVNQVFADQAGYTMEELTNADISIILPSNARQRLRDEFNHLAKIGKPWSGELKIQKKVSGYSWTDCVFIPIKNQEGIIIEYLYIGFLITEKKRNQQLKEKTLRLLETIAYRTSHKIRGPIASIEGLSMLIKQGMISEEEYPKVIGMLISANESLKSATTDLAHFANEHQDDYRKT